MTKDKADNHGSRPTDKMAIATGAKRTGGGGPRLSLAEMMRNGRGLWEPNGGKDGKGLSLPPLCGDFTITINKKGQWFYQGSPIGRLALCQLFAVCLGCDADGYFLATPAEKGKIKVEDLPFYGVVADVSGAMKGGGVMVKSSLDFWVPLDADHPFRMEYDAVHGQPRPIMRVRDNLEMLLSPAVFYDLATTALLQRGEVSGAEKPMVTEEANSDRLFITSHGKRFYLS